MRFIICEWCFNLAFQLKAKNINKREDKISNLDRLCIVNTKVRNKAEVFHNLTGDDIKFKERRGKSSQGITMGQ